MAFKNIKKNIKIIKTFIKYKNIKNIKIIKSFINDFIIFIFFYIFKGHSNVIRFLTVI